MNLVSVIPSRSYFDLSIWASSNRVGKISILAMMWSLTFPAGMWFFHLMIQGVRTPPSYAENLPSLNGRAEPPFSFIPNHGPLSEVKMTIVFSLSPSFSKKLSSRPTFQSISSTASPYSPLLLFPLNCGDTKSGTWGMEGVRYTKNGCFLFFPINSIALLKYLYVVVAWSHGYSMISLFSNKGEA